MIFVFSIVFLFIIRCRFPRTRSLAEVIRNRYGNHVLKLTRRYEKLEYKIRKVSADIEFLEACVDNELCPTFLRYKMSSQRLRNSDTYTASERLFLLEEITFKTADRIRLNHELQNLGNEIQTVVSFIDWVHICNTITNGNEKMVKKVKVIQNYKLSELIGNELTHNPDDVIRNYSSYDLSEIEKSLLVRGLNFAVPPKKLKYQDYLLPFELLYRDIMKEEEVKESLLHLKTRLKDVGLSSFRLYNKKDHRFENLDSNEYEAFLGLAGNENIIIQKADKGNTVVIVDKLSYVQKMEDLLSDTTKFVKVGFNPKHKVNKELRHILDMEEAIKSCMDDLLDNNYLSEEDYKLMKPTGSRPGIMYGLCKVHKDLTNGQVLPPFRPILSAIRTCTYSLAKFFVPILKEYTINEYTIKDSFTFAEEVTEQDAELFMVSFDVESLFTNIPLDETINICVNRLYNQKKKVRGLLKRHFKELLTLATKSSCFLFNGVYYSQIDGVAMGSPLGPTLANLFLSYHEEKWLSDCPVQFRPRYYRRYVDDVFLMFQNRSHVKKFQRYMNSRHQNIKFTVEEEENDSISFLDIKITRNDGKLTTSIYRKKTFSGVYVNYNSFLPRDYKRGLISTLLHRAYTICSDYNKLHQEISRLKSIWQKNSFPLSFIDRCIQKFLNKLFVKRKTKKLASNKKEVMICLVFLGKISIVVKKKLQQIFKECGKGLHLRIVFKSPNRLRNGFSFKDALPKNMDSLLLYKFTCDACNCVYIGETKRHFQVRAYEHLGVSVLTENAYTYNESNATAVNKHCHDLNHASSIDNFQIVGHASNKYHLRLKESLLIGMVKPTIINVQKKSLPLCLFAN